MACCQVATLTGNRVNFLFLTVSFLLIVFFTEYRVAAAQALWTI